MNPKQLCTIAIKDAKCFLLSDAAKKVVAEKGYPNALTPDLRRAIRCSLPE